MRLACLVCLATLSSAMCRPLSAGASERGKSLALVVGVGGGGDPLLPKVRYAAKDARDLVAALKGAGFDASNVRVLTDEPNSGNLATRSAVLEALQDVAVRASEGDAVLVVLLGNGLHDYVPPAPAEPPANAAVGSGSSDPPPTPNPKSTRSWFCCGGATTDSKAEFLELSEVAAIMGRSAATHRVLLLDCSRRDASSGEAESETLQPELTRLKTLRERGLLPLIPNYEGLPEDIAVVWSAASLDQWIREPETGDSKASNGNFVHFLVRGLQTRLPVPVEIVPSDSPDSDGDGAVTLVEWAAFTRRRVGTYSAARLGCRQTPIWRLGASASWIVRGASVPRATDVPIWAKVSEAQTREAARVGLPVALENSVGMRFVLVPAGTFAMGSPRDEAGRDKSDQDVHTVTISQPYYLSVTETTNRHFRHQRVGWTSGELEGVSLDADDQPVVHASWREATSYAGWLSDREGTRTYRLPSEEEWEYACRAGTTDRRWWATHDDEAVGSFENVSDRAKHAMWPSDRTVATDDGHAVTAPVGSYRPNPYGLFDMLGNAVEICALPSPVDPTAIEGEKIPLRGAGWRSPSESIRAARREFARLDARANSLSFRLVLETAPSRSRH